MERMTLLIIGLIVLVAVYFGYQYFSSQEPAIQFGNEINLQTFNSVLSNADQIFIVMDVRNITDYDIKKNILQCGVDLAGALSGNATKGLTTKNLTFYSFDSDVGCVGVGQTYAVSYCINEVKKGVLLYIHAGNESAFYTDGMSVGIGKNYTTGSCSVSVR